MKRRDEVPFPFPFIPTFCLKAVDLDIFRLADLLFYQKCANFITVITLELDNFSHFLVINYVSIAGENLFECLQNLFLIQLGR